MRASVHNIYLTPSIQFTKREAQQIPALTDSDRFRFAAKVNRRGDGECWLWTASGIPGGHGQMMMGSRPNARPYYAHRIAWVIAHGEIPDGMAVLHRCDVPRCVNPAHLFLGDQDANMKDAARKGRLSIARKVNRANKAAAIAKYIAGGVTQDDLALEFGVHKLTILRWCKGHHQPYAKPSRRKAS